MKMYSIAANDVRTLLNKANELGITDDQYKQIIETKEGIYQLIYFAED